MSFTFTPMTEEEIKSLNIMDSGIYDFEVIKAEQSISKSGNPMIKLMLKVWDTNGREHIIYDYLVSTSNMMYKIKHFCESVGLEDKYKLGTFDENDCVGKCGKVDIIIQKGQSSPNGGNYPDKNTARDYISKIEMNEPKIKSSKENNFVDSNLDDLPF